MVGFPSSGSSRRLAAGMAASLTSKRKKRNGFKDDDSVSVASGRSLSSLSSFKKWYLSGAGKVVSEKVVSESDRTGATAELDGLDDTISDESPQSRELKEDTLSEGIEAALFPPYPDHHQNSASTPEPVQALDVVGDSARSGGSRSRRGRSRRARRTPSKSASPVAHRSPGRGLSRSTSGTRRRSWKAMRRFSSKVGTEMRPITESAVADAHGRCAAHPFVQLQRQRKSTGEWKVLLDACPLCVAMAASTGSASEEPNAAAPQDARTRSRSRSLSLPRSNQCPVDTDDYILDDPRDANSLCLSTLSRQESYTLSEADSRPDSYVLSGQEESCDYDNFDLEAMEEREEINQQSLVAMMVSFRTLVEGDEEAEEEDAASQVSNMSDMSEAMAMIEDVRSENAMLHRSVAEATQLAKMMGDKLADFVKVHEATVQDYESKMSSLKEELRKSEKRSRQEEGLSAKLASLKEENGILRAALVAGEEGVAESVAVRTESKKAAKEKRRREKAERASEALRREVAALRRELEESRRHGRVEAPPTPDDVGEVEYGTTMVVATKQGGNWGGCGAELRQEEQQRARMHSLLTGEEEPRTPGYDKELLGLTDNQFESLWGAADESLDLKTSRRV